MSSVRSSLAATPATLVAAALAASGLSDVSDMPLLADAAKRFADDFVGDLDARLLNLSLSEVRDAAAARADLYADIARHYGIAVAVAMAAREYRVPVPGDDLASRYARITDRTFWTRHYLRSAKRAHEFAYIKSGFVSGKRELYVSDSTLSLYRAYKQSQQDFLNSYVILDRRVNEKGQHARRLLKDVVKTDTAKKAKLWAFLSGIEQLSVEAGLDCALLTLTLPASFHANPTSGGDGFDGVSTPREGNRALASLWNKVQRDLDNAGIAISGARFVEPHKDGTPHWHVWVHYKPEHLIRILQVLARYFPGDASKRVAAVRVRDVVADAAGALHNKRDGSRFTERFFKLHGDQLHQAPARFKSQVDLSIINRAYANGATYASKYAMKTLEPGDLSERVAASRWIWGMRGFQLFGINRCLGAWDEFFRTKQVPADARARILFDAVHEAPGLRTVQRMDLDTREVADVEVEGGTAAFIRALGGLAAARGTGCPAEAFRVRLMFKTTTNRYGDVTKQKLGFLVLLDDEILFYTETREPGRFMLVRGDAADAVVRSMRPLA